MRDPQRRPIGLVGAATARAGWSYRTALALVRVIGRAIFGFRTQVIGRANLPRGADGKPAGGWIAAGLPHRTWVDPFLVADHLPIEPRLVFFGDGPAIFRSRLRRIVFRRVGGVIPIWAGGGRPAVETYMAAAEEALSAGAILCIFPESGPATPPGTARPFGLGVAYFALRTNAQIVPLVLGGTEDIFRGRRFQLRILKPVTWQELAGQDSGAAAPEPWSSAERTVAHRIVAALHDRTAPAVAAAHEATIVPAGARKPWSWLTTAWH